MIQDERYTQSARHPGGGVQRKMTFEKTIQILGKSKPALTRTISLLNRIKPCVQDGKIDCGGGKWKCERGKNSRAEEHTLLHLNTLVTIGMLTYLQRPKVGASMLPLLVPSTLIGLCKAGPP